MATEKAKRYVLDSTGIASSNLVIVEPHYINREDNLPILFDHGLMFSESISLKLKAGKRRLHLGKDYELFGSDVILSAEFNKELVAGIVLKNSDFVGTVLITGQYIGGNVAVPVGVLADVKVALEKLAIDKSFEMKLTKPIIQKPVTLLPDLGMATINTFIDKLSSVLKQNAEAVVIPSSILGVKFQLSRAVRLIADIATRVQDLKTAVSDTMTRAEVEGLSGGRVSAITISRGGDAVAVVLDFKPSSAFKLSAVISFKGSVFIKEYYMTVNRDSEVVLTEVTRGPLTRGGVVPKVTKEDRRLVIHLVSDYPERCSVNFRWREL